MQTSGRSLHAQEMDFNDIRTTLQALCAIYDNANCLHTNAYDEAVTTPSEQSVRRALAIQMIIDREWGLAANENPLQGSFIVEELTDLVEEAVLAEFERITERGGVLGAMETGYQRGRIQDESMLYEHRKHDGSLPIVGVNTFLAPDARRRRRPARAGPRHRGGEAVAAATGWRTSTRGTRRRHPAALERLKAVAMAGETCSRPSWTPSACARSARSARRSSRSAGSTGGTCDCLGSPPWRSGPSEQAVAVTPRRLPFDPVAEARGSGRSRAGAPPPPAWPRSPR